MTVITPPHSFVRFDDTSMDGFVLPMFRYLYTGFQFTFGVEGNIPLSTVVKIGVTDLQNNILYENIGVIADNICSWGRITDIHFPMVVGSAQPVPAGTYNNFAEFSASLKVLGLNAYAIDFLQCCSDWHHDMTFIYNDDKVGRINFYRGLQYFYTLRPFRDSILFPTGINVAKTQCFKLAILVGEEPDRQIAYSNIFKRVTTQDFVTHVTYSCNEDAYGFKYPQDEMFNALYLPIYTRFPKYQDTRKVYIKSNKKYKVLSSTIEKEWEVVTDYLPDSLHEKMAVMFSHDNIRFINNRIDNDIIKKDDYTPDWTDDNDDKTDTAIAKCKIYSLFEGRNSNCEKRPECCIALQLPEIVFPDGNIGQEYSYSFTISGTAPMALFNVVKPAWLNIFINFNSILFNGTPDDEGTNIAISGTFSNCNGSNVASFSDTINVAGLPVPSLTLIENFGTVGSTRTQIFEVGPQVNLGNKYKLTVYSHEVVVTAVAGDTPQTIASKLKEAINNTTALQWNSASSAPPSGTVGFPPIATFFGAQVTLHLNYVNQFIGSASIS